jgi:KDO2-lipid IV(A) lauroyltransferase
MQRLVYLLSYPFLWIVSILPFSLFYAFSDFTFFLVYHVVGYRKKVVWSNLLLTFPEKDPDELRQIRVRFYRHMCDMFLEMVKTMNMDKADIKKHYHISNIELLRELEKTKSVLIVCAHYANWEWNVSINNYVSSKGYAIYQKVSNKYFDGLIKRMRSKWNTTPITQQETVRTVMRNEKEGIRGIYGIVSDQSPMAHRAQYWGKFMGVTVPIYNGPEVLARKLDLAVVFARVTKVKRGYYSLEMVPITMSGSATAEGEITEKFLRLTEDLIRQEPAYYLWTHRRWKHRDKAPKGVRENAGSKTA